MSHIWTRHVTHVKEWYNVSGETWLYTETSRKMNAESCHTYGWTICRFIWLMSYMWGTLLRCHTCESRHTYGSATRHFIELIHITHYMCHAYGWVNVSYIWMNEQYVISHNEFYEFHTYGRGMSHMWRSDMMRQVRLDSTQRRHGRWTLSHVIHMDEACHTYEGVIWCVNEMMC